MKRLALLSLFILPFVHYISAQTFQAGFYVGATMTDVAGTDNIDNDNDFKHLGFTVAGTVSTKISPTTRLQMELRFFQRGAQQTPELDTLSGTALNTPAPGNYNYQYNDYFDMTLNYVDVVIGVKHAIHFNLRNVATDRYGIEGGISIGSLVSYSYEAQSINETLDLNLVDISPFIGIYYNVTPNFYIEGRYSNSINSVIKHDAANTQYFLYYGSWDDGHNLAFSLTLGFNFGGTSNTQPASTTPAPQSDQSDN